jgi:hypothetical protein
MGFGAGLFGFLRGLLEMDIKNCTKPEEFFDKNNVSLKFLIAFSCRYEGSLFLSNILQKSTREILNCKDLLELNIKSIYESRLLIRKKKEMQELDS